MSTETAPRTEARAADQISLVTAERRVRGIDPGVISTLRTLDARLRRNTPSATRYGLVVDQETGAVTVEVGLYGDLPVRHIVQKIQQIILARSALPRSTVPNRCPRAC